MYMNLIISTLCPLLLWAQMFWRVRVNRASVLQIGVSSSGVAVCERYGKSVFHVQPF